MIKILSRFLFSITIYLLVVCDLGCFCSDQIRSGGLYDKIYEDKGYTKGMNIRLEPKIYKPDYIIWALAGIDIKNRTASINEKGEWCFLELSNSGNLSLDPIITGIPKDGEPGLDLQAERSLIWQVAPGGVDIMDIDQKKFTDFGCRDIVENKIFIADYEKKIMYGQVHEVENIMDDEKIIAFVHYFLYDMIQSKIIFSSPVVNSKSKDFHREYFSFSNQLLIDQLTYTKKGPIDKHEWYLSDLYCKKSYKNSVTKTLTNLQISQLIKINTTKRKMFVYSEKNGFYYIISWDESLKDSRYTMLHFPERVITCKMSSSKFDAVDNDFNWFVGYLKDSNPRERNPVELVAFRIDDSLPAGISGPIKCGFFHPSSRGTFMNHEKWGPCYLVIENYKDENNILYVFTLEEGLKLIRK